MNNINSLPLKSYLSTEWEFFKEKIDFFISKNLQNFNFTHDNFEFVLRESLSEEYIFLFRNEINNNSTIFSLEISKFLRIMEFEKGDNKNSEIIFDAYDIQRFIEKYQLDHPLYYDNISNKEKSVTSDNLENIMKNKQIKKIYDDGFANQISKNEFYLCMKPIKLQDFYINKPDNDYSNDIFEGKDLRSFKRTELIQLIKKFSQKEGKDILFLGGGNKTGKTITILSALKVHPILYFNIKLIKSKTKKNDKKKLIYRECMHLFTNCDYNNFSDFYNKYMQHIKGYNKNIWQLVDKYCKKITEYDKILNPIVVIDDYDDIYMKKEEILNRDIINQQLLIHKKIKFIVCGNGNFIDDLIYRKIAGFGAPENNYEVLYNNDLDLKINDKPFMEFFLEHKEENYKKVSFEFKTYFNLKYKAEKKILSALITFEEYVKSKLDFGVEDPYLEGFPIQFFKIIREGDNPYFSLDYLYPKLFEISNDLINYYILSKIMIQINIHSTLGRPSIIQGYLIERYIISMFENNIMITDFEIPKENIITVEEIYNINSNNISIPISNTYPILIKQSKEGIHYDFAIILEKNKEIYALIIQVGLNKKKCEISRVFIATYLKYKILINALSNLIGKIISKISLMFIFSKEKQEELIQKLDLLKNELSNKDKKNKGDINSIKKKISNVYVGKNFTKEFYIPYLEFSHTSNSLYCDKEEIKCKETFLKSFWPITNAEYKIEENGNYNFSDLFPGFSKDFQDYLKEDDIKEFKVINLIKDCKNIIQDFGMMMFILIDLKAKNQDIIIIHKDSNNKNNIILKYRNNIFEKIKLAKFKKIIDNSNPELIYLCKKVYLDPEEQSLLDYMSKGRNNNKRKRK